MKTIYKYVVEFGGVCEVAMPKGAEVLSVTVSHNDARSLWVWAAVDTDNDPELRVFRVFGTGHPLPDKLGKFHGTHPDGPFFWHVFEEAA